MLSLACFAIYVGGRCSRSRVSRGPPDAAVAGVLFVLGPLAALAALQLAVCVSSRVNDARSAQQIGALIILPISGLLIAQFRPGS